MIGEFKHEVRQFQKPYDNQQAWLLQGDGTWLRATPVEGETEHNAQRYLLDVIK